MAVELSDKLSDYRLVRCRTSSDGAGLLAQHNRTGVEIGRRFGLPDTAKVTRVTSDSSLGSDTVRTMSLSQMIADYATAAGVIVALVFGIRSEYRAGKASDRAEAAARTTESYTQRVVDALERIAATGGIGSGATPVRGVRWKLEHHQGDRYRLTNDGDTTARNVEVSAHESLPLADVPPPMDVEPGHVLSFMAARTLGTSDSTITVSWADTSGRLELWKYPLPPR